MYLEGANRILVHPPNATPPLLLFPHSPSGVSLSIICRILQATWALSLGSNSCHVCVLSDSLSNTAYSMSFVKAMENFSVVNLRCYIVVLYLHSDS